MLLPLGGKLSGDCIATEFSIEIVHVKSYVPFSMLFVPVDYKRLNIAYDY